jgi:molybdate transport system substrate-binding protein
MKLKQLSPLVFIVTLLFSTMSNARDVIRVYAAASMTNAIKEIALAYEKGSGVKVTTVFAGSSSLARQIERGAPADIYISANKKWVDYLEDKQVVSRDNIKTIAGNSLVLIAPMSLEAEKSETTSDVALDNMQWWMSQLNTSRLAIGQMRSVPAGIYAKQSLQSLGVWEQLKSKTAPVSNVRLAMALVERAEATLGIVYATDAAISDRVTIIATLPDDSHLPIAYPAAKLTATPEAEGFYAFLSGEEASRILVRYGFSR